LRNEDLINAPSMTPTKIRKFYTYAPSEASIYPLELDLRKNEVRIVGNPPSTGTAWIMLFLPTFVILGFIYLMVRRGRDQFGKNTP
jgi:cell division protease FtsH